MYQIKWTWKGGKLPDAKRFKVDIIIGMTSLAMAKVTRKDAGELKVTLKNEYGTADVKVNLIVFGMF